MPRNKNDKRGIKNYQLQWLYGITLDEYEQMIVAQKGKCGLCGSSSSGTSHSWHVDHSAVTGKVRSLLCHHCNVGLGHFRDSPGLLDKAAAYLRKHKN